MGAGADARGMDGIDWRWLATRVVALLLVLQVVVAGALLWERNVNRDGWGELPFSWQMYSGRVE